MQILVSFLLAFVFFFSACSQKVNVRALEPAQIDRASSTKKITVTSFTNDTVGLSGKIESKLASQLIDNKRYFTIVSRADFDKVIQEQKLQNSGLIETSTAVDVGNLIGAEAIISGNVGKVTSNDSYYYEQRTKCANKKCTKYRNYNVRCLNRVVGLSSELRMVNVSHGDIIYAENMSKSANYYHCSDDSRSVPSKEIAAQSLANLITNDFTYKLTPHYRNFEVILLEKPDLDYNEIQEKYLEVALEYIKQKRYDKAEKFLIDLIDSTAQQSYVPFYNLGVIKEVQGNYSEAQTYYKAADDLMVEPVAEISSAYLRIESIIEKNRLTQEQLAR